MLQQIQSEECPMGNYPQVEQRESSQEDVLAIALYLLDYGRAEEADELLTMTLIERGNDYRLWLAAGICRMRKGSYRTAVSALKMSVWLSDDPDAKEALRACEEICI